MSEMTVRETRTVLLQPCSSLERRGGDGSVVRFRRTVISQYCPCCAGAMNLPFGYSTIKTTGQAMSTQPAF